MKQSKRKAFTLIELVAVLIIMAIIALIVTPLVMSIIRKARISADKRSIDAYGRSIELAIAGYLMDTGAFPTDLSSLTIEYTGYEVNCNIMQIKENGGVYLSECTVNGKEIKDKKKDGYYHYGNSKPNKPYSIGDEVTYNGMKFYVIRESNANSEIVTLLKSKPLTTDELNTYGGVGTINNHVNVYLPNNEVKKYNYQIAYNLGGYGGMVYYTSSSCGYYPYSWVYNGCTIDYSRSEIKYVIDAWVDDKFLDFELIEDDNGYKARLITIEE